MLVVRVLILFWLLTSIETLYAQSAVSGTVVNATSSPIPFASVTLKRTTDTKERLSHTDSTGIFSFNNLFNGTYSIVITCLGYEPYEGRLDVRRDTTFTIQLQQIAEQLGEVTVIGTKSLIERSADKIVYNVAASVTATGNDAIQAIGQIPGVRVNNNEISMVGKAQQGL